MIVGLKQIELVNVRLIPFILAVITYYLSVFLFAIRWKYVLKGLGYEVKLLDSLIGVLIGLSINAITPMSRAGGEMARALWIKLKSGVSITEAIASMIYERILEGFPVAGLLLSAILLIPIHRRASETLAFIIILGLMVFILRYEEIIELLSKRIEKIKECKDRLIMLRKNFQINIIAISTSSAVWMLDILRFKLLGLAINLSFPWKMTLVLSISNLILSVISVTPGGVGIVEGGLIGIMLILGYPKEVALSLTILERFISLILGPGTGAVVLSMNGGLKLWKALK
ncbi:lysylphosphatidylglycerol synthase transmembrane domain-containing protein [Pyrococcus abyssi]|uniref:Integral membrane protein n=1 Tax=Pyrococcus abyssi (strain GE5 / Orsay) TaxID=272844 RepID=Q9UZA2_PYRAB|nr:YbhN family protein [Pyrococcus abyssi]CAB50157.1 Integral membrane protein [Pyrococcus abyssi GE5]CCE70689.1 TPA: hypothetical protein PAB0826 [Pyrococcus abyssi GE5]